jgi:hypothetical protein
MATLRLVSRYQVRLTSTRLPARSSRFFACRFALLSPGRRLHHEDSLLPSRRRSRSAWLSSSQKKSKMYVKSIQMTGVKSPRRPLLFSPGKSYQGRAWQKGLWAGYRRPGLRVRHRQSHSFRSLTAHTRYAMQWYARPPSLAMGRLRPRRRSVALSRSRPTSAPPYRAAQRKAFASAARPSPRSKNSSPRRRAARSHFQKASSGSS